MLLLLPCDIRFIIYDLILADTTTVRHSIQPCNTHFRLLNSCRLVYYEARLSFHRYVSLRNEFQIKHFHNHIFSSPETALSVRWADVANDGRIVETLHTGRSTPASQLYRVLAKLPCLERLRVFDVRHYHPYTMNVPQLRYHLDFEGAMYPHRDDATLPHLASYELYLDPSTRVTPFDRLPDDRVCSLRLSGECRLSSKASFPALRHLTIRSVTSNAFDRLEFNSVFAGSQLESFIHSQGDRLGFEVRNIHLQSLIDGPGRCLRKLVLLGCARLSSSEIASCLRSLPTLHYFALSIVTVNELRENFILALGPCLRTLKLQVTHAWYAVPLFDEERVICNSLEERVLSPNSPLATIYISFHSRLMIEDRREERWKRIAHAQHLTLKIGPWEDGEET
ncbi:hypothetical protein JVT61DRAFT_5650 [Boletus reticuloceps]|uniref:Uncharacterized protein n=1 Tax=Boletus reticuloceps TaxID=495285 RepID=A0A8I3AG73_9AGAM|nr:hypothetical protein JVT61DRAFT_5650 [Boletus reticuloceps]